jgi:hypothetical protein
VSSVLSGQCHAHPCSRSGRDYNPLPPVAGPVLMDEGCGARSANKDWAGNWRSLAGLWGIPAAAMLGAMLLEAGLRAGIWSAALIWMGGACIANARRCGRTHCLRSRRAADRRAGLGDSRGNDDSWFRRTLVGWRAHLGSVLATSLTGGRHRPRSPIAAPFANLGERRQARWISAGPASPGSCRSISPPS